MGLLATSDCPSPRELVHTDLGQLPYLDAVCPDLSRSIAPASCGLDPWIQKLVQQWRDVACPVAGKSGIVRHASDA